MTKRQISLEYTGPTEDYIQATYDSKKKYVKSKKTLNEDLAD